MTHQVLFQSHDIYLPLPATLRHRCFGGPHSTGEETEARTQIAQSLPARNWWNLRLVPGCLEACTLTLSEHTLHTAQGGRTRVMI